MINNVVLVSGAQQSNSAIYIHVSILPQTPILFGVSRVLLHQLREREREREREKEREKTHTHMLSVTHYLVRCLKHGR